MTPQPAVAVVVVTLDRGIFYSVQAVNIDFTSRNEFGLCSGNVPGPYTWHYRLVR